MITAVRRRWSALDNPTKQIIFVIAGMFTLFHCAGLAFGMATGEWAPLAVAAVSLAITAPLAGLGWLAGRLFPTEKGRL